MEKHHIAQESCCTPAHGCCSGMTGFGFRRFYTREERLEHLEHYKGQLKKELEAVEEHLKNAQS
ncbi:DUF5320 domain-containing protein [bacterium]|nr:DUF5320 domain-containing protein [bacterium]